MIISNKYIKFIAIGLGVATLAFMISTIVLAVQNGDLNSELVNKNDQIHDLEESLKTTTIQSTTQSTTTQGTSVTVGTTTIATTSAPTTAPTTTVGTTGPTSMPTPTINYRLPDTVIPEHYDLYLYPHVDTGLFEGQSSIWFHTLADVTEIVLHSLNLNITNYYLERVPESTYITKMTFDAVREFVIFELSEPIVNNTQAIIGLIFNGVSSGKIVGLYSSSYLKEDGSRKVIATSKFEPTYARQAFPCFDEPGLKATFEITLVVPNTGNYNALSNMDIKSTELQAEVTEVNFNRSVPMSTYLTCFIVSDFGFKSVAVNASGIGEDFTISVYATPEQINKLDFALDVGKTIIEYYIQYFNVPYPLPKLDMAAIPDFVSGAMEHWGLVTYRETALLYEEGVSSSSNKQRVAEVIAHEFAHMWFGNLVTMKWWNDLWLNEGFASYIENKGVAAKFPNWKMEERFLTSTLHDVFETDSSTASHPIIQTVETPDQITEIFDTITYSKGASIIRMLEQFIGSENFQKAVTNYLVEYEYMNAVTANFLDEIDKLNLGINVTEIMRTWTEQMGLPVITVTKLSDTRFRITQKRFLSNPDDYEVQQNDSPFNYKWSIPVSYVTNLQSTETYQWFYYNQNEIIVELASPVNWIKFNHNQVGYYRVNYEQTAWEGLCDLLRETPTILSDADRASLLNDAFALADATQLPYETALRMTSYLSKETEYVPWAVASSKLTSLKNKLMFTDAYVDYQKYAQGLIEPIYEYVTWNVGTDDIQNLLRINILSAACSLGLKSCLTEAGSRLRTFLNNPAEPPHPDLRSSIYYYGMMEIGDETTFDQMWDIFVNETDASEKARLMQGLAGVQVPWILNRYMNLGWNEEYVRGQDYFSFLGYISGNPVGKPLVWDHVRENWQKLVDRFGLNERYLGNLIPTITRRFFTQTKLEEIQTFFAKYPEAGAGTAARGRALSTVRENISWLENNLSPLSSWLITQQTQQS